MSEQDERDQRRRDLVSRRAEQAIRALLTNVEGLRRLRDISDEEWQEAVDADEGERA